MLVAQNATAVIDVSAEVVGVSDPAQTGTPYAYNGSAYAVDTRKGEVRGEVSSRWFNRPADERFNSIPALLDAVKGRRDRSKTFYSQTDGFRVVGDRESSDLLIATKDPNGKEVIARPNHWSFSQMASLAGAPASFLAKLPADLAAADLDYLLGEAKPEGVQVYAMNGQTPYELRALTGPGYTRVYDADIVKRVMEFAGDGTGSGGARWKVPGQMNWSNMTYDPENMKPEGSTLWASDRDVFMFLVDDRRPIQIGTIEDGPHQGAPDLLFRGFYVTNSEVGSAAFKLAAFYLRAVCQNRNLWGVEGFHEVRLRHTRGINYRNGGWSAEASRALRTLGDSSERKLIEAVNLARVPLFSGGRDQLIEQATQWLGKRQFSKPEADRVVKRVITEEGRAPRSVWDLAQGITAIARDSEHQDTRTTLERRAQALLDKVRVN